MARYSYLIILLSVLLYSCAQVGVITGGEKDVFAPKPLEGKVNPPNASVNFSGNEIVIPFDEYFTLSNPSTSIQIVPPHATINAFAKGKTLTLSWEETLRENTTYAIYLNNTVKDLAEKNDSIMQYVFSTGSSLDSNTYATSVVDAYTNVPIQKVVVALYDPTTGGLVNFAQTDRAGVAQLTYLRPGTYSIIAFKDENNDLNPQATEEVGFLKDSIISIDSSGRLIEPIRLFAPQASPEILSAKFEAPASFIIETNVKIENPSVSINETIIDPENYVEIEPMKLRVFVDPMSISSGKIALTTNSFSDTASFRVLDAQKRGLIRVTPSQGTNSFAPSQAFSFKVNDLMLSVDTNLIRLRNSEDSTLVPAQISFSKNELTFNTKRGSTRQLRVEIDANAITTKNGRSTPYNGTVTLNSDKKYGVLSIDVSSYSTPIILQVIKGTNVLIEKSITPSPDRILIPELEAGDYVFKIIRDENGNGVWDTGNLETRTLPEQIDQYSKPTTVRANWEIEVELIPIELKP